MFNYTKEVIINKVDDTFVKGAVIVMPRIGNYKAANILDGKIYETVATDGNKGSVAITVPASTDGDIFRLTMFLATPNRQFAEFGTPCWEDFGKPIIVEVAATKTPANDAQKLADAIKLAAGEYVEVSVAAAVVTVKVKESWMDFQDVTLAEIKLGKGDVINEEVIAEYTEKKGGVVPTRSKEAFGDYDYIIHHLRFPTAPNLRFAPLNADELPVRGAKYNQYVFKYVARHNVPGGLSGVDQCVDSITSHVFFVKDTEVAAFKKLFEAPLVIKTIADGIAAEDVPTMNPYSVDADAAAISAAKDAADKAADKVDKLETRVAALEA